MENKIIEILKGIIKDNYGIKIDDLKLWIPPKAMFWDYSFNAGILSKTLKKNPNLISEELKINLEKGDNDIIDSIETSGPYLNIKIDESIYTNMFLDLYKNKENLIQNVWKWKNIVIDYVWANVWKPLHIAHMCTPNQGQAMVNIYKKLWYDVISDSHIGDWGIIFWKLILAYTKWWNENKLKNNAVDHLLELYIKISQDTEKGIISEEDIRVEFKLLSEWNSKYIELWESFT